ncbi:hypothetical protein E4U21_006536 [Claviceps maximensis]|nr:hypothetical protein E4U21_006536 [Claviceps maximensis]
METTRLSLRRSAAELSLPEKQTAAQYKPSSRSNLIVAIRPRPRYVPGTGPALQPLRLLPHAASTGYIIERILLPSPGLAADGRPLPKRMTYIVGWHDLPAASLRVPAMDILDFVSSRALEEWEDRLEGEMDEHRQHFADDTGRVGKETASQKTRRRPPAHTAIEQPAAIESETELEPDPDSKSHHHTKSQGVSLSTPKKRKLTDFEGLSDEDNSPTKQLARESLGNSGGGENIMSDVVGRHNGRTIISAMDRDLAREDHVKMPGYKRPSVITPVPLPPLVTYKSEHAGSGLGASTPNHTIVSLGMDRSSDSPREKETEDPVVFSIEGSTLSTKRGPVAPVEMGGVIPLLSARTRGSSRDQQKRRTSTSQTPGTSVQRQRRSESSGTRRKKQRKGTTPPSQIQTTATTAATVENVDDSAWEVERLEDMALYEVENQGLVRYFLVRWVGDWPSEQNPSWEPEGNIPADLVRTYTKMDKKRRAKLAASHQRPPPDPSGWALQRQYQSVSEAFEGNLEQDMVSTTVANGNSDNHSPNDEVFIVTEEVQNNGQQRVKETPVPLPPASFAFWTSA